MVTKVIFITAGTSIPVPNDWNPGNNTVELIGGGAGGGSGSYVVCCAGYGGAGGGGGGYTKATNVSFTGNTISYVIGAGGAFDVNGSATTFKSGTYTAGGGIANTGPGSGGTGTTFNGGDGGQYSSGSSNGSGGGGGGAAGFHGAGNAGGNGGTGVGGGSGDAGFGGAGGATLAVGGNGSEWTSTNTWNGTSYTGTTPTGGAGGGGGPSTSSALSGKNGGIYGGGGGGGAGDNTTPAASAGGAGGNGLIILTYVSLPPIGPPESPPLLKKQNQSRSGAIMRGIDEGVFSPFVFFNPTPKWPHSAQDVQPPAPRFAQRAAMMPSDAADGGRFTQINYLPFGWEVQSVQPPHIKVEARHGGVAVGEQGTENVFYPAGLPYYNFGFENQPPQPPSPVRSWTGYRGVGMRGDDGIVKQFANFFPLGFEQVPQPQPPRWPQWNMRGLIMPKDDGTQAKWTYWVSVGFEEVPQPQPPHPRPERSGAVAFGDQGHQYVFYPQAIFYQWGWDVQPPQPPNPVKTPQVRAAAIMPRDDGNQGTFTLWRNFGWMVQPHQPQHRAPELKFASIAPHGDDSNYDLYRRWFNFNWENQAWQPPHPKPERSGAIMPVEPGNESLYVYVAVGFTAWGYEQPFIFPRYPFNRGGALSKDDLGNVESVFFLPPPPMGWEVPAFEPRFNRSPSGFAGMAPRDDGVYDLLRNFLPFGFEVQPPQPPWPRVRLAGAFEPWQIMAEAPFFLPPPPMGWEVAPPFFRHPRPERAGAVMAGEPGNEAQYQFVTLFPWGHEQPFIAPRVRFERSGAVARGSDGTDALFSVFQPVGWAPSEPVLRARYGWHGPEVFELAVEAFPLFAPLRWVDNAKFEQIKPWPRRGGALAVDLEMPKIPPPTFVLGSFDFPTPPTYYRRRYTGAIMPWESTLFIPRYAPVFYATSIITRYGGIVKVTQASAQTNLTSGASKTVVKGEKKGQ